LSIRPARLFGTRSRGKDISRTPHSRLLEGGRIAPKAVADRLHLSEGHRLAGVLPVDRARRLLALYHRLEAVLNHGAEDVTDTLNLALQASGLDQAKVAHRPRLLSDNGSSYIARDWPIGSKTTASIISGDLVSIPTHRARSSAGIRR
jgi:hypothetical protein